MVFPILTQNRRMFTAIDQLTERELAPGYLARLVHTDQLTIAHLRVTAGSILPEHQHPHEQVTNILEGEFEMTVDGETRHCTAGSVVVIPGNTPHSARAITDCRLVDVFHPAREDYK